MALMPSKTKPKRAGADLNPIIDPRLGDIEDDSSSAKRRSLLSLAGSMLVEISLPKLVVAWVLLLILPGLLIGLAPMLISSWLIAVTNRVASLVIGVWSVLLIAALLALGWFGWRPLFRWIELSFWSLNSIVVEPGYAACREAMRHIAERLFARRVGDVRRGKLRATTAAVAGILILLIAALVVLWAWPETQLFGHISQLSSWTRVASAAFANSIVFVATYLGTAALLWGFADAAMDQPRTLTAFQTAPTEARRWRIAHLSDVHVVGERYGFRLESGRLGPRGNERFKRLLRQLDAIHAREQLDCILLTGDMTDAGISSEWAEFLDALASHPKLAKLVLMLPGNHDLNIVDRANPARMDLPMSPNRRLRELRTMSTMVAVQGARVRVVDRERRRLGKTLAEVIEPHRKEIERFADSARPRFSTELADLWAKIFPMVVPPDKPEGLGIVLFDSNADTHFSFTNALGMISAEQIEAFNIVQEQYPEACWLIGLHHHLMEYPWAVKALSERIGTALINGNWVLRQLKPLTGHAIFMHGHRHIDWMGECAGFPIISAPSPVMGVTDDVDSAFYIHTLAIGPDGRLRLLEPQRIVVKGEKTERAESARPQRTVH
jgi:hypothetical protein